MLNVIFFASLIIFFATTVLEFAGVAFKKENIRKFAWIGFLVGFVLLTVYIAARGVVAERLPLSNQFEFATAFSWGIALMLIFVQKKMHAEWMRTAAIPMAFLVLSYAALQPREITELMPALRSTWFGLHIGSAVFSYSAFVLAGCAGLRYIRLEKKCSGKNEMQLKQMDFISYRMIALGFLLLTVVILSGAIWAEQAWSAFWTWDPKEVWALITWIIYAVYLHLRLRYKYGAHKMAMIAIIAVPIVFFTFAGVNTLLPGLHSYG